VCALAPDALVEAAWAAGVRLFQLRSKILSDRDLLTLAREMRAAVPRGQGLFVVNDRIDIAVLAEADGVHLGQNDLPIGIAREQLGVNAVVGISTHDAGEALDAEARGATYVGFGPMGDTASKAGGLAPRRSLGDLSAVRAAGVKLPVFAIGGVRPTRAADYVAAGASGVAVISAVCDQPSVEGVQAALKMFRDALERGERIRATLTPGA